MSISQGGRAAHGWDRAAFKAAGGCSNRHLGFAFLTFVTSDLKFFSNTFESKASPLIIGGTLEKTVLGPCFDPTCSVINDCCCQVADQLGGAVTEATGLALALPIRCSSAQVRVCAAGMGSAMPELQSRAGRGKEKRRKNRAREERDTS